ncbi:unnamed protein product [Bubo scandiacus]
MEPGAPPAPHCALEPRPPYEPVPRRPLRPRGPLRRRLRLLWVPLLQGHHVPLGAALRLHRHLPPVLQGAGAGDAAEPGGQRRHRPGHRAALRAGHHAAAQRRGSSPPGYCWGYCWPRPRWVAAAPVLPPPSPWVPAGSLLGLALLCALLALQWPKALTVLSTGVFGAAVVVVCADYFVEGLALVLYVYDRLRLAPARPLCWPGWVVLGAWPLLGLLAVLLQWKLTADGFSHTDVILSRRQKRLQLLRIRQKEAKRRQSLAPPEGTYRRKTPPPSSATRATCWPR